MIQECYVKNLLTLLCDRLAQGAPVALAEIVSGKGSTPRGAGSRLLADAAGLLAGTVGGGLAEGQTLRACAEALADGAARILDITLTGEMAARSEMICGGQLRILVEPLKTEHLPFFLALREAVNKGGAVLVTDMGDPAHPLRSGYAYTPESVSRAQCAGGIGIAGGNAGEARPPRAFGAPLPETILSRLPGVAGPAAATVTLDGRDYLVSLCLPPDRLILAGGGHVSRPTAQVAALAGFAVTVLDDRPEFSRAARFPWAEQVLTVPEYSDCFAELAPDARTCIVIVTRGHLHDAAVLAQALATRAGYIGMIGSKRKRAEVYAALRARGVDADRLAHVHCPVGLPIAAETPEEIAVSIVAECIAWRRQACCGKL